MSVNDDIAQGLDEVVRSAFVSGHTKKSYEDANPTEAASVLSYLEGGDIPNPFPKTLMGSGLSKIERGRREMTRNVARSAPTGVVR